jgi:hypothetical protein
MERDIMLLEGEVVGRNSQEIRENTQLIGSNKNAMHQACVVMDEEVLSSLLTLESDYSDMTDLMLLSNLLMHSGLSTNAAENETWTRTCRIQVTLRRQQTLYYVHGPGLLISGHCNSMLLYSCL